MLTKRADEVSSDRIRDNETWNTCPDCFKDWKDATPIPGLLHRTRLCGVCLKKRNHAEGRLSPKHNDSSPKTNKTARLRKVKSKVSEAETGNN
jgi:hypothetical protein